MKRIILQHWDGPVTDTERASWDSIRAYAKRIGSEYSLLVGEHVGPVTFPHMHKLTMLDEKFDQYEQLVMLDSDMFARPTAPDIFRISGCGVFGNLQRRIRWRLHRRLPGLFNGLPMCDYYGGAVYKFTVQERQRLRRHLTPRIMQIFDSYYRSCDEGAVHYLATMEQFNGKGFKEGERWACSSFHAKVDQAYMVHVRRRVEAGKEARVTKAETLGQLVDRGVLTL